MIGNWKFSRCSRRHAQNTLYILPILCSIPGKNKVMCHFSTDNYIYKFDKNGGPKLCGFVCSYHTEVSGSNTKHTMNDAIIVQYLSLYCERDETKQIVAGFGLCVFSKRMLKLSYLLKLSFVLYCLKLAIRVLSNNRWFLFQICNEFHPKAKSFT